MQLSPGQRQQRDPEVLVEGGEGGGTLFRRTDLRDETVARRWRGGEEAPYKGHGSSHSVGFSLCFASKSAWPSFLRSSLILFNAFAVVSPLSAWLAQLAEVDAQHRLVAAKFREKQKHNRRYVSSSW